MHRGASVVFSCSTSETSSLDEVGRLEKKLRGTEVQVEKKREDGFYRKPQ